MWNTEPLRSMWLHETKHWARDFALRIKGKNVNMTSCNVTSTLCLLCIYEDTFSSTCQSDFNGSVNYFLINSANHYLVTCETIINFGDVVAKLASVLKHKLHLSTHRNTSNPFVFIDLRRPNVSPNAFNFLKYRPV